MELSLKKTHKDLKPLVVPPLPLAMATDEELAAYHKEIIAYGVKARKREYYLANREKILSAHRKCQSIIINETTLNIEDLAAKIVELLKKEKDLKTT